MMKNDPYVNIGGIVAPLSAHLKVATITVPLLMVGMIGLTCLSFVLAFR
jgi:hypothetical protein